MASKNITLKIDEETYDRARVFAAQHKTSVSALVRESLQKLVSGSDSIEKKYEERRKALEKLWKMADSREQPGPAAMMCREDFYDEEVR